MNDDLPMLSLEDVSRRFGTVAALDGVSLDIGAGQVVCLVGHSGCGKSTLLRIIAGVESLDGGVVRLGGKLICGQGTFVEPEHRNVGFMFQDYALFPHLSVRQNIGFGLRKLGRSERRARVDAIIDRIGIGSLADRHPHMLSGGEQQRVALARALAPQPSILLMDEPFSNLDRGLRDTVRRETLDLIRTLGITAVIVTHDPEEALAIGDVVALMREGRLVESGPGDRIYDRPATLYAAGFFSELNAIPARPAAGGLDTPFGPLTFPAGEGHYDIFARPQSLFLSDHGVPARVVGRATLGEIEETRLVADGVDKPLVMRSTGRHVAALGDAVHLAINPRELMVFSAGIAVSRNQND